jgi:hypothetical protein
MSKLFYSIIVALIALTAMPAKAADATDSEGYPIVYLRGSATKWATNEAYRFSRNGEKYSLHLSSLSGEFKISDCNWNYEWGFHTSDGQYTVTSSVIFTAIHGDQNIKSNNLSNVDISFSLSNDASTDDDLRVTIIVDGGSAVEIDGTREVSTVSPSGTLPILYINVYDADGEYNDEIISKDLNHKDYFSGKYWLDLNGCQWLADLGAKSVGSEDAPLDLEIKARGNYTRTGFAKKPFKLKLGKKQDLLGLTPDKSKHYAILAHADDSYGYMRNFTGFNLGKRIGLPWTPAQQPIEVIINGDYRGIYFLTESIRVGDGRVPIEELGDNVSDPTLASGGYLVELDNYNETNQIRMTEKTCVGGYVDQLRITWDTPEEYSDLQKQFITDQFTAMNDAIGSNDDTTWSYIDLDDAVRYYICKEIISDVEAYHGSTYLYRDRGEGQKWHFSPLWDCGNAFNGSTTNFFYDVDPYGNTWIPSLRANDKFNAKLRETWLWFMSNCFDGLYDDIATEASRTAEAAKQDRKRWADAALPISSDATAVCDNSDMNSARDRALNHLKAKIAWLSQQFGDYTKGTYSEPARDTTQAAPLPEYLASGVEDITIDNADALTLIYNLQGIRVTNPVSGNVYIIRHGQSVTKQILR